MLQYYDKALAIDPNDKHALDGKGNALYNQGNNKLAIQYYDKALAIDPHYMDAIYDKDTALNNSSALVDKGNALYGQGKYTEAMPDVNQQLTDNSNKVNDKAVLLIYSDGNWSGSILDTSHNSATQQGSGDAKIPFDCKNAFFRLKGIYSLSFQKGSEGGSLHLAVMRDGKLLKEGSTTAAFGIVSFAGTC